MDVRVLVRCPDTYAPERAYILDVLLSRFLGLEHRLVADGTEAVELTLDGDSGQRRLEFPDVLFGSPPEDWLTPRTLPALPLRRWEVGADLPELAGSEPLPIVFSAARDGGRFMTETDSGLRMDADLFGSAFFCLTRYEEIANPVYDDHDRFSMHEALAYKEGFLERPIVNEYADVLFALLKRLWPGLERTSRAYRLVVTHDVDVPLSVRRPRRLEYARTVFGDATRRRDPALAARRMRAYLHRRRPDVSDFDPAFTFDFFLRENERHGVRCLVNFMTETGGYGSVHYSLEEPWARALFRDVHRRGHLIGFHPSFDTYRDPERLRREFERLRAVAEADGIEQERWGGRQHWLRWENPTTWQLWDDVGLDFDSSLAYDLLPGFRCSTCYPFRVFNLEARRPLDLEEWPLTWMEVTLIGILGLQPAEGVARAIELQAACKRHGGDFTILWHNDSLVSKRQRAAYVDLLDQLA
jgi:hypothetical protein